MKYRRYVSLSRHGVAHIARDKFVTLCGKSCQGIEGLRLSTAAVWRFAIRVCKKCQQPYPTPGKLRLIIKDLVRTP